MIGAEDEIRTRDLNLGKVALYQLSYFRMCYKNFLFPLLIVGGSKDRNLFETANFFICTAA